tara:strand:+ start:227 stop:595 length:369 start_codon:yes stop_codon:yes gene_type:complete
MKYPILKIFFTYLLLTTIFFAKAQSPCNDTLCVIEFNASFNQQNSVDWLENLTGCKIDRINIDANIATQQQQMDYGIVIVPTIIIFNGGEEVKRYQANIMMEMETEQMEIQKEINKILLNNF